MSPDVYRYTAAVVFFALFATAHLSLAVGLAFRPPRWRGPASLLCPPLAPFWGFREGLRARAALWVVSLLGYGAALMATHSGGG